MKVRPVSLVYLDPVSNIDGVLKRSLGLIKQPKMYLPCAIMLYILFYVLRTSIYL